MSFCSRGFSDVFYYYLCRIKATASIIFLHGLGDTGLGWSSLIDDIRPPYMQYSCPTADTMPVSLNLGFQMPSW